MADLYNNYGGWQAFTLGEMHCNFRNDPKSETNRNVLKIKKWAAERKNQYINSKHTAKTEMMQSQKDTNSENKCNKNLQAFKHSAQYNRSQHTVCLLLVCFSFLQLAFCCMVLLLHLLFILHLFLSESESESELLY